MPALLTSAWISPSDAINFGMPSRSWRSYLTWVRFLPAASWNCRSIARTCQPAPTKACAVARPMPRPAPVMRTLGMDRHSSERAAILAAVVSSALGGSAAALTRYTIGASDPVTLAAFRFGIAFLLILPLALALRSRWPQGRDWLGVAALGVMFFAVFFVIYNVSMSLTTAAR